MAIQPIDLQALFTQVDKVGKAQMHQREGLQIQEALKQEDTQRKLEQNVQSVNQSQEMGHEAGTIKDDNRRRNNQSLPKGKPQEEESVSADSEVKRDLIKDPALGSILDISG